MIRVSWQDQRTNEWEEAKPWFVTSCTSLKPENGLGLVTQLAFKTTDGHPKLQTGDPWMVVDPEVDPGRDGGMSLMTSGDVMEK